MTDQFIFLATYKYMDVELIVICCLGQLPIVWLQLKINN